MNQNLWCDSNTWCGKKLIPVTNRIYWYPPVCEVKTREFRIPDKWSASAWNSVSQEKWRGGVRGKVRAELMNNSHCSLNCCSVENKLYYVKGNWKTHHRKLFCAFDTHSFPKCKKYAKRVLFSAFQIFYDSQNNRTIFFTSWYHN